MDEESVYEDISLEDQILSDDIPEDDSEEIALATISSVGANGVTIQLDGSSSAGTKEYKVNAGVLLKAGDRVKVHKNAGTYLIEYAVGAPMSRYPIPSGGSDGQMLVKDGAGGSAVKWETPHGLPSGGSQGQVLRKSAATDYSVEWATVAGIPSGGAKDQYLKKTSASNYEVAWADPPHDLPTGGTNGQVLTKDGTANYSVKWADVPHELPTGGTANQVLTKNSSTNYDVKWAAAPSPSALSNGSYSVTCANNGFFYPSAGQISLGASSYYFNGCYIKGAMRLGDSTYGNTLGFFGTTPQSKQTVSTSATLTQLIQALNKYGLV